MKIEEAVSYLKDPIGKSLEEHDKAVKLAIESLEKEVPKKLMFHTDTWTDRPRCGICNRHIKYVYGMKYCPCCGNAIDWGEIK